MPATIQRLDRQNVRLIRDRMQAALNTVATDLGLRIDLGRITFNTMDFTFRGTSTVINTSQSPIEQAQTEWDRHCTAYGLQSSDYGKRVYCNHKNYTLIGFKTGRRSHYPILAKRDDGRTFRLPVSVVLTALGRTTPFQPRVTRAPLTPITAAVETGEAGWHAEDDRNM